MRRAIAALLLACLGVMIPLAATPVRLCLLEHRLLIAGVSGCGAEKAPCCPDCGDHHEDPCCLEVEDLPDATLPSAPDHVPPAVVMDLPEPMFMAPVMAPVVEHGFLAATPIRGPDTPSLRRAVLGVWRL